MLLECRWTKGQEQGLTLSFSPSPYHDDQQRSSAQCYWFWYDYGLWWYGSFVGNEASPEHHQRVVPMLLFGWKIFSSPLLALLLQPTQFSFLAQQVLEEKR